MAPVALQAHRMHTQAMLIETSKRSSRLLHRVRSTPPSWTRSRGCSTTISTGSWPPKPWKWNAHHTATARRRSGPHLAGRTTQRDPLLRAQARAGPHLARLDQVHVESTPFGEYAEPAPPRRRARLARRLRRTLPLVRRHQPSLCKQRSSPVFIDEVDELRATQRPSRLLLDPKVNATL